MAMKPPSIITVRAPYCIINWHARGPVDKWEEIMKINDYLSYNQMHLIINVTGLCNVQMEHVDIFEWPSDAHLSDSRMHSIKLKSNKGLF